MKILVTGGDGQLGKALRQVLPNEDAFFSTRKDFDITNRKQTVLQITSVRPSIVIHTAAYTDVDGCEKNKELAFLVNVKGTENVALACKRIGSLMFYISTDYVFDGKKSRPYKEDDKPNPLSVYGKTKLQGEEIVKKLQRHFIIRTAWLFGAGKNFVQTILNLTKEKQEIEVVNDQIGSPTYALDLAKMIYKLIYDLKDKNYEYGIYHITNDGKCSWYEFAKEIIQLGGLKTKMIPITTEHWQKIKPDAARRPKYSVLDCSKIKKFGIKPKRWKEALRDYFKTF